MKTKVLLMVVLAIGLTACKPEVLDIGSTMIEKDGATLLYVPAGEFTMGSDDGDFDEQPIRQVYLDAFWIDQTEVTNKQYAACVSDGGCIPPSTAHSSTRSSYYGNPQFDDFPVVYVDWDKAVAYCSWVGRELPTDAQWEKAARGTDARIYPWGNEAPDYDLLNFNQQGGDTLKVGSYESGRSFYGAYDMAGNVWEWVNDSYPDNLRVMRGGSWFDSGSYSRCADRIWVGPSHSSSAGGFRCARSLHK